MTVTTALPHLSGFLSGLPDGLNSHADALAKASLAKTILDAVPDLPTADLPDALQALVRSPPPVSTWMSEARFQALLFAVRDLACADDASFSALCYRQWRTLFESPLYRIMFATVRPTLLLRASTLRWRTFHRGSTFEIPEMTETSAVAVIRHPPGLWGGAFALAQVEGLRVILDLSGAKDTRFEQTLPCIIRRPYE